MALIDRLYKEAKNIPLKKDKKVSLSLSQEEFEILNENSKLTKKSKQELIYLACKEAGLFKRLKRSEETSNEDTIQ